MCTLSDAYGETAHQKNKNDYRWEFSELVEKYFDDFIYAPDKKNYKGNQVIIKQTTPKFGYVIVDVIPPQLETYNLNKGWHKTPFNSYYKINTWREDKFERSVANGTETVFVTLRFCVVRKQLKATLKPNAAGVQLPPHYYRNG